MKFATFTEYLLLTLVMGKGIYKWTWQQCHCDSVLTE